LISVGQFVGLVFGVYGSLIFVVPQVFEPCWPCLGKQETVEVIEPTISDDEDVELLDDTVMYSSTPHIAVKSRWYKLKKKHKSV
jgi:hypothetical protein